MLNLRIITKYIFNWRKRKILAITIKFEFVSERKDKKKYNKKKATRRRKLFVDPAFTFSVGAKCIGTGSLDWRTSKVCDYFQATMTSRVWQRHHLDSLTSEFHVAATVWCDTLLMCDTPTKKDFLHGERITGVYFVPGYTGNTVDHSTVLQCTFSTHDLNSPRSLEPVRINPHKINSSETKTKT